MTVKELAEMLTKLGEDKQNMSIFLECEAPIQPDYIEVSHIETCMLYEGNDPVETLVLRAVEEHKKTE